MATFSRRNGEGVVAREGLVSAGPRIPIAVGPADFPPGSAGIPSITGDALLDTGAALTVLDLGVLGILGLAPADFVFIASPSGTARRPSFSARVIFPDLDFKRYAFSDFVGADLASLGVIAIVGRRILADFVLAYDGPRGEITVSG